MTTTADTPAYVAIGRLADRTRANVPTLEKIAERLGIVYTLRLNGIPYVSEADAERITNELRSES